MTNFPIIGIPINTKLLPTSNDFKEIYHINHEYCTVLSRLGALPILLPYVSDISLVQQQISACDGILLGGGDDICPLLYGEEPQQNIGEYNEFIDQFHLDIANLCISDNKPLLGICRGALLLEVILKMSCQGANSEFSDVLFRLHVSDHKSKNTRRQN